MISIRIPCYNQPSFLHFCLQSISQQTYKKFEILLIDDQSKISYKSVLKEFEYLPITYYVNKRNLGAVPNMLNALCFPTNATYVLVLHEDDILEPVFLEKYMNVFTKHPDLAFACSYISFFNNHVDYEPTWQFSDDYLLINEPFKLVRLLLEGKPIGLGTVVYNRNFIDKIKFDFEKYSVMGDRPMLVNLSMEGGCAVIPTTLQAVYSHPDEDHRWKSLRPKHVLNLYHFYKGKLPVKKSKEIKKIFKVGSTHGIIFGLNLINSKKKYLKIFIYTLAIIKGLFSIRYYLLANRTIRVFVERFKGAKCV